MYQVSEILVQVVMVARGDSQTVRYIESVEIAEAYLGSYTKITIEEKVSLISKITNIIKKNCSK
jgi:hypothetical protein